jgi:glycerophosphoryl diester phosphodiesterase
MTRLVFIVGLIVFSLVSSASGATQIDAHRGGPNLLGEALYPEESLEAMFQSARRGARLEMDTRLSSDGVPVLMHDPLLDRTTDCTGPVREKTLAQLRECKLDLKGSPGNDLPTAPETEDIRVQTLAQALRLAKNEGARVTIEINNYPGANEAFDATYAQGGIVADVVLDSGIPQKDVIFQSFVAANVNAAKAKVPGAQTALIALANSNRSALDNAKAGGFDWLYPSWPLEDGLVDDAHAAGIKVSPYTLNSASEVRSAIAQGVDSVITDDPAMALQQIDTKKPSPTAKFTNKDLAKLRSSGKLPARIGLNEAGSTEVDVLYKGKEIGETFIDFEKKGSVKVKVKVRRKALKGLDRAKLTLRLLATDLAERSREKRFSATFS